MTEPDAALLWAREDSARNVDALDLPEIALRVRAGEVDCDAHTQMKARCYRAGQQASEARVARLEAALQQISLCSQNSTSSREECGRIARAALTEDVK